MITIMLTSFGVHQPDDMDIFFYYNAGNEILHGDGSNVFIANAGIGWPVTLAFFTDYVGDVFTTAKSIALISSVLIIFSVETNAFEAALTILSSMNRSGP